jgi:hypothetical protein
LRSNPSCIVRACEPSELIVAGLPRSGSAGTFVMPPTSAGRDVSAGGGPAGGVCANSAGDDHAGDNTGDSDRKAANAHERDTADMNRRRAMRCTKGLLLREIDSAPHDR